MLGTNWNEVYYPNIPIGYNLDELIGDLPELPIEDIFNPDDWDFS